MNSSASPEEGCPAAAHRPRRVVVISQPMYFPWVGMLEQVRLADAYVHYDDVQFSKGSFTNRVQIKTPRGVQWLTIPLESLRLGQTIREVRVRDNDGWRARHLDTVARAYADAPYVTDALTLMRQVLDAAGDTVCDVAAASMAALAGYFELGPGGMDVYASGLSVGGKGSQRVLDVVRSQAGTVYVSGHGGRNYLDHPAFERVGIRVEYMAYQMRPYAQLHGEFTPYVSALDLVANQGRDGRAVITSGTVPWTLTEAA